MTIFIGGLRAEGLDTYPENVLEVHENFTSRVMESSAAKVEIVYGKPVRNRILKKYENHSYSSLESL
jgi:hypothetical protein